MFHNRGTTRIGRFIRKSAILRNPEITGYYRNIFTQCDSDKDGYVSLTELKEFIVEIEEHEIPEEVVQKVLRRFDKNKDERLDFQEFLDLINNPRVLKTFSRIGSSYIKYIGVSSIKRRSLTLRRTVTNTGTYEEEITFRKRHVCLVVLSILQLVLFYVNKNTDGQIKKALEFHPFKRAQVWRYLTYIFVHKDEMHLYDNLVIQTLIGIPLEMVHFWRVPLIYMVGACGACMLNAVVMPHVRLRGASGGVFAFFTAHIAVVLLNWKEMTHPIVHLIMFGIVAAYEGIYTYFYHDPEDMKTSYTTHLGGVIIGFLMGVILLRNLIETKNERLLWYLSLAVFVILMTNLVILNVVLGLDIYSKV